MSNFQRRPLPPTMAPACRTQILPPLRYINSSLVPIQQPIFWSGGFYGVPSYPPMTPFHQQQQHRPPNSGPIRNRRRTNGSHKAEPQTKYQYTHESSGTAFCDRSNGVRIDDANNNPGIGKLSKPYSRPVGHSVRLKDDPMAGHSTPTPAPSESPSDEPISTVSASPDVGKTGINKDSDVPLAKRHSETVEVDEIDLDAISLGSESDTE